MTRNTRGALWMLSSAVTFTVMMSLVRLLGEDYPAPLQAFYRQLVGFTILAPLVWRGGGLKIFATRRPGLLMLRSSTSIVGLMLSFYSFQHLPLAFANTLSFTRTLWIVPLAILLLRERVGVLRISAALVGFAGVLVMSAPGDLSHSRLAGAAGLAAALLLSVTILGLKSLTRDHSSLTLLAWDGALGLVFALPAAFLFWHPPSASDLGLLGIMGCLGIVTQLFYIKGMTLGDAAAMAPIDYSRLVFAAIIGFLAFGEIPGLTTIVGALVIAGSTLLITWREHAARRPEEPEAPPPS